MEIIKRGTKPSEKSYETTCRECGTEFRFKRHEATYVHDQRDGDYLDVGCPHCKHRNAVAV